ncbi:phosphatidylserine decarboxylase 1 [Metarhizium acridum]|nr:phosphatidylserine decarboxylase 1 [Metarhizium acridum]
MTYSVDALLGKNTPTASIASGQSSASARRGGSVAHGDEEIVKQEEEFAKMNGISYTLPDLLSGQADAQKPRPATDESTEVSARAVSEVRAELALGEKPWYDIVSADKSTSLYYGRNLSGSRRLPQIPLADKLGRRATTSLCRRAVQRFAIPAANSSRFVYPERARGAAGPLALRLLQLCACRGDKCWLHQDQL